MPISSLDQNIQNNYEIHEFRHAVSILKEDFPNEFRELEAVLNNFQLAQSEILTPGGGKSPIASRFDNFLYNLGWQEHQFKTSLTIDGNQTDVPTHKIDCYKNRIALEIEWNNKDPFFDRDLNNFRLLFERGAISVGIIITRCTSLQQIFAALRKGHSYGASTTHMNKLIPRIKGGSGGGCPILVFGITPNLFDPTL